jgi:acetoin utilization deacetylase AcuC-like enzyme
MDVARFMTDRSGRYPRSTACCNPDLNGRSACRLAAAVDPIPYVWSDRHRAHEPGGEVWVGVRTPGTELPERAGRIRAALAAAGLREVPAALHPDAVALALHAPELVGWLRRAWADWAASGLPEDPGQDRVVPYLFAHPALLGGLPLRTPAAVAARAGRFVYDTMTLIGPGTWEAARAAVDVALTGADLVAGRERVAYALCRPPGHHVTRDGLGGSCYLNNAAAAAARLRAAGAGPVALLDVDAHHGNGAQSLFWEDATVLTGSVHVDPGAGWFPHFVGFATERGAGAGEGANLNLPLAPGTGDGGWLAAVAELAAWARAGGARSLVVALGVDAAAADPESPLRVSAAGYREAGRVLGALALPTVVVQEGGYHLATIGPLVLAFLEGLAG